MPQIISSQNALDNLQRTFVFPAEHEGAARAAAAAIRDAMETLARHPLIGRRIEGELRELIISFGKTGYVALYRFLAATNQIRIQAIRHQRELDYPD